MNIYKIKVDDKYLAGFTDDSVATAPTGRSKALMNNSDFVEVSSYYYKLEEVYKQYPDDL